MTRNLYYSGLNSEFEQLNSQQRSMIRRAVRRGDDAEIDRQASKYGVERDTILKIMGHNHHDLQT